MLVARVERTAISNVHIYRKRSNGGYIPRILANKVRRPVYDSNPAGNQWAKLEPGRVERRLPDEAGNQQPLDPTDPQSNAVMSLDHRNYMFLLSIDRLLWNHINRSGISRSLRPSPPLRVSLAHSHGRWEPRPTMRTGRRLSMSLTGAEKRASEPATQNIPPFGGMLSRRPVMLKTQERSNCAYSFVRPHAIRIF